MTMSHNQTRLVSFNGKKKHFFSSSFVKMVSANLEPKQTSRVFFREFKLSVAPYIHSNGHIVLKTSSHFKIYRKQVPTWIRAKKKKKKTKEV